MKIRISLLIIFSFTRVSLPNPPKYALVERIRNLIPPMFVPLMFLIFGAFLFPFFPTFVNRESIRRDS